MTKGKKNHGQEKRQITRRMGREGKMKKATFTSLSGEWNKITIKLLTKRTVLRKKTIT